MLEGNVRVLFVLTDRSSETKLEGIRKLANESNAHILKLNGLQILL